MRKRKGIIMTREENRETKGMPDTESSSVEVEKAASHQPKRFRFACLNALQLKVLAMALMLCDHLWATLLPQFRFLTAIGRLAFPIFAFQLVEGFYETKNRKRYLGRMFLFALIAEIPFNLMLGGSLTFPFHQNVLFTFCIGLLMMSGLEKAKQMNRFAGILTAICCVLAAMIVGAVTFVDYQHYGVLMILVFYLARNLDEIAQESRFPALGWLIQLVGMVLINWNLMGGLVYPLHLFGKLVEIPQQGFAVLALIPIWLYNGKQGPHNRAIQIACYAFYPVHALVLGLLMILRYGM